MGLHLPSMHFPPPLINPATHPWMAKAANMSLMTVGRVIVPAVAVPIATSMSGDGKTHWLPNVALSAALGAVIGGAAGLWFPKMEHDNLYRADALRSGVMSGLFGAPAVSLAVMGTATFFLKDLLPYGGGKVVPKTHSPIPAGPGQQPPWLPSPDSTSAGGPAPSAAPAPARAITPTADAREGGTLVELPH